MFPYFLKVQSDSLPNTYGRYEANSSLDGLIHITGIHVERAMSVLLDGYACFPLDDNSRKFFRLKDKPYLLQLWQ